MTVLIDTSVIIGLETERLAPAAVAEPAALSVVTLEELYLAMLRAGGEARGRRRRTYEQARAGFELLAVDADVAVACAAIRADGRSRGVRYQAFDSLIGATASVHSLPLYTQDAGMLGMLGVDVRVL